MDRGVLFVAAVALYVALQCCLNDVGKGLPAARCGLHGGGLDVGGESDVERHLRPFGLGRASSPSRFVHALTVTQKIFHERGRSAALTPFLCYSNAMTTYRLLSVNPFPAVCDGCGTECPERHLVVADEAGTTLKLGTTCAYRLAGVKPTDRIAPIEVEVTEADRQASADFVMWWMNGDE